eukprot:scaffold22005_cov63-Phaeocystis_antarctica.AAC.2
MQDTRGDIDIVNQPARRFSTNTARSSAAPGCERQADEQLQQRRHARRSMRSAAQPTASMRATAPLLHTSATSAATRRGTGQPGAPGREPAWHRAGRLLTQP